MMRLDVAMVERGLARSRNHAQALIGKGVVLIGDASAGKPSLRVEDGATITLRQAGDYVGRAAGKLNGALDAFGALVVEGRVCFDAGASTGGFTQVLLERGAESVYAVDVGHGQLSPDLAADRRVHNIQGLNIRGLTRDQLPNPIEAAQIDLVVGDLSFISLTLVIPVLAREIGARDYLLLVKPQFEVGRARLGRGGVVRDPELWTVALHEVLGCAENVGLGVAGVIPSQVPGGHGNREFFVWLQPRSDVDRPKWEDAVAGAVQAATQAQEGEPQ